MPRLTCRLCKKEFKDQKALTRHVDEDHQYNCFVPRCGFHSEMRREMWRHIRQCHSKEIPRFQLKEEELVRGETCLKRPPTPTFDDIGPAPEYTIDEEVETNANNNAKEDWTHPIQNRKRRIRSHLRPRNPKWTPLSPVNL